MSWPLPVISNAANVIVFIMSAPSAHTEVRHSSETCSSYLLNIVNVGAAFTRELRQRPAGIRTQNDKNRWQTGKSKHTSDNTENWTSLVYADLGRNSETYGHQDRQDLPDDVLDTKSHDVPKAPTIHHGQEDCENASDMKAKNSQRIPTNTIGRKEGGTVANDSA